MTLKPPAIVDLPLDDPLGPRPTRSPAAAEPAPPAQRRGRVKTAEIAHRPQTAPPRTRSQDGDPYGGSPKIPVTMRATKDLWDRLGVLTRRLEDEGMRTSRTELTEALWHFHAPQNTDEARGLIQRYRRARVG
jgi:hypothetical protein